MYEIWQPSCCFLPGRIKPHSLPSSRSIAAITLQGLLHRETWWICDGNDNIKDGLWNKLSLKMIPGRVSDPGGWVHAGGCRAYAGNGRAKAYRAGSSMRRTRLPLEQSQISPITPGFTLWKMTLYGYLYGKCHDQSCRNKLARQTRTSTCQSKNNRRYIPLRPRLPPWVAPILVLYGNWIWVSILLQLDVLSVLQLCH